MEVQKIENFKMPNAVAHEITQEELQRDFDYYRAQKVLETMFMFGMISVDEFHKISAVNRKTFSPFLAEIDVYKRQLLVFYCTVPVDADYTEEEMQS